MKSVLECGKIECLTHQFHSLSLVSKTDFDEVESNLLHMEDQCKNALGYLTLADAYDRTTKKMVEEFLVLAAKEMVSIRLIKELVTDLYEEEILGWLGVPLSRHREYSPAKIGSILSKFSRCLS